MAGFILAVTLLLPRLALAAGQAPVALGEAAHFAILAGAQITYPGSGSVVGDVGADQISGAFIFIPAVQVTGTVYEVDAGYTLGAAVQNQTLLNAAVGALTVAYNNAAGRTPVPTGPFLNPGSGDLGGLNLTNGLYKFTTTANISTDVTLTGGPDDVWIFQCGQDLEVANGVHVILAGGAQAKNVFWQVTTKAVLGTSSVFKGTIMAGTAITLNSTSTIDGRALAGTQVTFGGTSATLPPLTLTVVASPTNGGSVTGSGTFLFGSTNPITEVASNNWTFFAWNDGNTSSPRNIVLVSNVTYTAYFINTNLAPATITVMASPANAGSVTGNGTFPIGSPDTLLAVASNGWVFTSWNDGDLNSQRIIAVVSNTTYTANFTTAPMTVFLQQGAGGIAGIWTLDANYQPTNWTLVTGALGGNWDLRSVTPNQVSLQQGMGGISGLWATSNDVPYAWTQISGPLAGWIVRDVDGNRVLLQQGDGGWIGLWTLGANSIPTMWIPLAPPFPGLIARALSGNRVLVQVGMSTEFGFWTMDSNNLVTSWLQINNVGLTPGWILRDMTQNYILLQQGDGGMAGLWKLDANGVPIAWYPITGPLPGWILKSLEE